MRNASARCSGSARRTTPCSSRRSCPNQYHSGTCAASSILQWRPFLVSGLLGTADLVVRGFYRFDRDLDASPNARILMMLGLACTGMVVMLLASYPDRAARSAGGVMRGITTQFGRKG